ncbi:hypothetical protein [Nesterenkonia halotolerans]|uniref:DUF559 domain-containing protein n=1 Tax=Nesterenkonia halotolerans TaxID=225325 RepID=A0ABR9J5M2_9MICC|nr:hypothetical protein [Nesterenkonia halotolerans]MBE1514169.1 hypothetical protein [Nesterenkonia halotolerans]
MELLSHPPDRRRRPAVIMPALGRRRARLLEEELTRRDLEHSAANGLVRRVAHGIYTGTELPGIGGLPGESEVLGASAVPAHHALLQGLTEDSDRVISFDTAAVLWGLLPGEPGLPFHVTSPREGPRVERPGLVLGHRIEVSERFIVTLDGVRLTHPAWTWLDLALHRPLEQALILGDRAVRRPRREYGEEGAPLATLSELRQAAVARGRTKGIRQVREVLELIRVGSDSPQETRLRYYMHLAGLPEPRVNPVIAHPSGYPWFEPDLAVEEFKVSIQYEGEDFHSSPASVRKDVRRSEITEELGWVEVRITQDHMADQGRLAIARIQRALLQRGWRPPHLPTHG